MLKVSFASHRPDGPYALAIPAWSEDMISERLAGFAEPARTLAARAADAQRFEREPASIAETFIDENGLARRVLLVGLGGRRDDDAVYERIGGALTARLLTSGETRLVIDLSGLNFNGRAAARVGFGAAARSWRQDQYRTRLGRKQKPTLEEVIIVGGGEGVEADWAHQAALLDGLDLTRTLVTEPANILYPESFVARCREALEDLGVELEVLDEPAM